MKILCREGLIFTIFQGAETSVNVSDIQSGNLFSQLSLGWFQLHFLQFPSRCQCYQIVLQEGDALFLPSQWIHFGHTSVDSLACACNLIMETHLHERAQASKKEQDAPLARTCSRTSQVWLSCSSIWNGLIKTAQVLSGNPPCVIGCRSLKLMSDKLVQNSR